MAIGVTMHRFDHESVYNIALGISHGTVDYEKNVKT